MSPVARGIRQWCREPAAYDSRDTRNPPTTRTRQKGHSPMNATTGNIRTAAMRASDADRDAALADLSEHFQAGRLTAEEVDAPPGQARTARTWGKLRELLADLPAPRPWAGTSAITRPQPPSGRAAPPLTALLAAIGIVAVLGIV